MRRHLLLAFTSLIAVAPAHADGFGCALPADPWQDAAIGPMMGQTEDVTTPALYGLDPTWGDPVDLGTVWLDPSGSELTITMELRDLEVSDDLGYGLYYQVSWEHPDVQHDEQYRFYTFPTGVYATFFDGEWSFAQDVSNNAMVIRREPAAGSADADQNLISWTVPTNETWSGTRMTELNASTSMGTWVTPQLFGFEHVGIGHAADQSDPYGGDPYVAQGHPRIEFELDAAC